MGRKMKKTTNVAEKEKQNNTMGVENKKKRPEHLAPRKKTFRHKRREGVDMTMHPRGTKVSPGVEKHRKKFTVKTK